MYYTKYPLQKSSIIHNYTFFLFFFKKNPKTDLFPTYQKNKIKYFNYLTKTTFVDEHIK